MYKFKMKNIFNSYLLLSMLLVFAACNDDEGKVIKTPNFPDQVEINISQPGEVAELSFEVDYAWNLSSSKIWCKFISDNDTLSSLSGSAGKYTIQIMLNDDAWTFADVQAAITMGMLQETKVIATLQREAQAYLLEAYGKSEEIVYDSENPVNFVWNIYGTNIERAYVNLKANFDWKLISYPDWMSFTYEDRLTGASGELKLNTCTYSKDAPIRKEVWGELIFADKNGEQRVVLPVKYEGIPADVVQFEVPGRRQFDYVFNVEGTTYWEQRTDGSASETSPAPLEFTVVSKETQHLNLGYFKSINNEFFLEDPTDLWYSTTYPTADNDWSVAVRVEANEGDSERSARIVVLPDTVFHNDEVQGNFENILEINPYSGKSQMKAAYSKYAALAFKQEYVAKLGFTVTDANGVIYPAPIFSSANEEVFGTKNVFWCRVEAANLPEQFTIEALGYGSGVPEIDPMFNGSNSLWPGLKPSFNSSNQFVLKNVAASATSSPIVLTYKKNGEIYAVLLIMKI